MTRDEEIVACKTKILELSRGLELTPDLHRMIEHVAEDGASPVEAEALGLIFPLVAQKTVVEDGPAQRYLAGLITGLMGRLVVLMDKAPDNPLVPVCLKYFPSTVVIRQRGRTVFYGGPRFYMTVDNQGNAEFFVMDGHGHMLADGRARGIGTPELDVQLYRVGGWTDDRRIDHETHTVIAKLLLVLRMDTNEKAGEHAGLVRALMILDG